MHFWLDSLILIYNHFNTSISDEHVFAIDDVPSHVFVFFFLNEGSERITSAEEKIKKCETNLAMLLQRRV